MPDQEILEYLRQGIAESPIWKWFGITVEEAAEGTCKLAMPVRPEMPAAMYTISGGR